MNITSRELRLLADALDNSALWDNEVERIYQYLKTDNYAQIGCYINAETLEGHIITIFVRGTCDPVPCS